MRLSTYGAAWVLAGAFLLSCSPDPERVNFAYLRSPSFFRADTALAEHPFCDQENPLGGVEACRQERKYKLTWLRPEDTTHLLGYRIYLDTAHADKPWNTIKGHPELASLVLDRAPLNDSVIFVFTDGGRSEPDTLGAGENRIVAIDSSGRTELLTGRLMFGLVPVYGGNVTPGQPQFSYFVTTDRQPPDVFHPEFRPLPHGFTIAWERPTDRVSYFNPSMDTGIISGYRLELQMDKRITEERRKSFKPKLTYYLLGGEDSASAVKDSLELTKEGLPNAMYYSFPDGRRSAKHVHPDATDSMRIEIEGLLPQDTLKMKLWAIDSAGNSNQEAMEEVNLLTTDTTRPSAPKLSIDSLGRNGFVIVWQAARDSVPGPDGKLVEAARPNANIKEYRLTRLHLRAPGENATELDRVDTLIQLDSTLARQSEFRLFARFLPPGATYRLSIFAEDSSGYPSRIDTLTKTTLQVDFAESDSDLACPPGFVPVPRGKFLLGDPKGDIKGDEVPVRKAANAPFCIEPYEHRDSTGKRFVSNVTWEQAEAICRAIDSTYYDTRLCSETEWERACEGPLENGAALLHGIQSEQNDPSILQTSCNQATNDSAMAMNYALRNAVCLTTEGIYDLAGNLSEWVRDTYAAGAYAKLPADSVVDLDHGFTFADSGLTPPHSIRGGNYLKVALSQQAQVQSLARCSNRDYPEQVRPVFRHDCVSENRPMVAVIYGPGLEGHRCMEGDPAKITPDVTDLQPAPRDTFKILVFHRGVSRPDTLDLDTAGIFKGFKGRKPQSALITRLTLAEVRFESVSDPTVSYPDTLDATEFRDTTQAGLEKIFRREAANPDWTVHKENGRYAITYKYAYTLAGSKPALPYYSSRAIGFRCCSLARKPAAPADSLAANR